jgi:DNA-binding transcriptional LysR family regulator
MDVAQLRAFLAVAEELHFRRAAERLHIAQPPLSRTIQQLERELGTSLFERSTRSVRLTAAGKGLLEPARQVMDALRRAEAAVHAAEVGEVGLVRIGFAGVSSYELVAQWARVVRQHRPGIRLELYSQNFALPAMRKLAGNDVDVALGRWDQIPAGISSRVAARDSLVVAVPDTHPLAQAPTVSMAELRDEAFISLPPYEGAVLPDRLRRLAHDAGFAADVVQVAPDTLSALALVSAEVGCHLTLASVAQHARQTHVDFVTLQEQTLDVDLQLAWRTDNTSPALAAVLGLAEEFLAPGPGH